MLIVDSQVQFPAEMDKLEAWEIYDRLNVAGDKAYEIDTATTETGLDSLKEAQNRTAFMADMDLGKLLQMMVESPEYGTHFPRLEGMRYFYDKRLPQDVKKYLKKFGIVPERVTLEPAPRTGPNSFWMIPITPEVREFVANGQYSYQIDKRRDLGPAGYSPDPVLEWLTPDLEAFNELRIAQLQDDEPGEGKNQTWQEAEQADGGSLGYDEPSGQPAEENQSGPDGEGQKG